MADDTPETFDQDQFFQAVGIDSSALSSEEKKQIAVKFLSFFMLKVLHDIPQVRDKLDDYFQEFRERETRPAEER